MTRIQVTIPWEQMPEVLAAENTQPVPGGPTDYLVPGPTGNSLSDVTSFHPGQATWSLQSMPDIIYVLFPDDEWLKLKNKPTLPPQKRDGQGQLMWELYPEPGKPTRALLDWKILPDKIGTREHFWLFEAVRRLRPDVRWADITMRMERANRPSPNTLQMRACRYWRTAFCMLSWHTTSWDTNTNTKGDAVLARLSLSQLKANTTRGSTPGLIDPALGQTGSRILVPTPRKRQGVPRAPRRAVADPSRSEEKSADGQNDIEEANELSNEEDADKQSDEEKEIGKRLAESKEDDEINDFEEHNDINVDDEMSSDSDSTESFVATRSPVVLTDNEQEDGPYQLSKENAHAAALTRRLFALDNPKRQNLSSPVEQSDNNIFEQSMNQLTSNASGLFWGSFDEIVTAPGAPYTNNDVANDVQTWLPASSALHADFGHPPNEIANELAVCANQAPQIHTRGVSVVDRLDQWPEWTSNATSPPYVDGRSGATKPQHKRKLKDWEGERNACKPVEKFRFRNGGNLVLPTQAGLDLSDSPFLRPEFLTRDQNLGISGSVDLRFGQGSNNHSDYATLAAPPSTALN